MTRATIITELKTLVKESKDYRTRLTLQLAIRTLELPDNRIEGVTSLLKGILDAKVHGSTGTNYRNRRTLKRKT